MSNNAYDETIRSLDEDFSADYISDEDLEDIPPEVAGYAYLSGEYEERNSVPDAILNDPYELEQQKMYEATNPDVAKEKRAPDAEFRERNLSGFKHYYETPVDIFSFFREKESIAKFLQFYFDESANFAQKLLDNSSIRPSPVYYNVLGSEYQTDYNYFIYLLAKWVGIQTGDMGRAIYVLRDYALTVHNIKKEYKLKDRRMLSIFLHEKLFLFKRIAGDNAVSVEKYATNQNKIVSYNNEDFEFLLLNFSTSTLKFYLPDFEDYAEKKCDLFQDNSIKQAAYSYRQCNNYWKSMYKKGIKKRYYFNILDNDFLKPFNEILEKHI